MKTPLLVAAALLAATPPLLPQNAGAADATVVAHLDWEPGVAGSSAPRQIPLATEPPAEVVLPAGIGKPYFARIALADGQLALALDANPGNPRLWVDRDFNGDLAEEKTTRLARQQNGFSRAQLVLAPYDDEAAPAPLEVLWSCDVKAGGPTLSVRLQVHRRGAVVLGGRLRLVAVVDGDGDARFDDRERDQIYLDLDGDGALRFGGADSERVRPGQPFRVGDEGWSAQVATASGRVVEFTRSRTVPPAALRGWPRTTAPQPGRPQTPPRDSLATLLERFEGERTRPYAQRYPTVNAIGSVGTPAAFDALVDIAAAEKDASIRSATLRALGNPAFVAERGDRLAGLARDADGGDAHALAQALYYAGHPDRDAIYSAMLDSSNATLVSAAARWLAYSGSDQARQAIVAAIKAANNPSTRYSLYTQGARSLPDGPPLDLVLQAAEDDYPMLRAQAIKDLGVLGHPDAVRLALRAAAERPVQVTMGTALCEILGAAGTPAAVAAILGLLEDDRLPAGLRKQAVDQLRLIRAPKSVDVVVKALNSKLPTVRGVAAEVLASLPELRVTEALLKRAKKEKDDEVLPLLLEALGDHEDPMALSTLLKHTRGKRQPAARAAAVRGLARIGFHHDKVRAFFLTMLDSRDWVDRVLALDAARATRDAKLLAKVLGSLDHARWQVRLAAIDVLAALRHRDGVLPLIERLDDEEEQRVRDAIAVTLFSLTGVNASDNAKTWRLWWSEKGATFTVPDEIPIMPDRSAGGTGAGFYGIPVVSERVVFLIDQSGSMSAMGQVGEHYAEQSLNRLDIAVRETLGALAKLDDRALVNVILFHSTIHPWRDQLQRLSKSRKELQRTLESKQPTGGTNIYDGLELALQMKDVDTIFLLSDGAPGQGKYVATPDILRGVRRENQTRRIAIHCVAVGMDSELLRRLAAENGGRYVRR